MRNSTSCTSKLGLLDTFSGAQTYPPVFGVKSYHNTDKTSIKRWLLSKIKLTLEKKIEFHCKEWWAASIFVLFPGLFAIIAQSAQVEAKHSFEYNICGGCHEMAALWIFALWDIV